MARIGPPLGPTPRLESLVFGPRAPFLARLLGGPGVIATCGVPGPGVVGGVGGGSVLLVATTLFREEWLEPAVSSIGLGSPRTLSPTRPPRSRKTI